MQHYRYWMLSVILSILSLITNAQYESEYRVKALFLYNFTQFVQWPEEVFNGQLDPLVIGILGPNPFGNNLRSVVASETANGRYIIVKQYDTISQIKKCHLLFITKEDTTDMNQISTMARSRHILLVSDASADFLDKGGMIRFVTRNNRIQFQINLSAIKAANLSISSKMLRLAEMVMDN